MLTLDIPDALQHKIRVVAQMAEQTPEQLALEMLEEHLDHLSAYQETAYLRQSTRNRERLDHAIGEIRQGVFEERTLLDD